MSKLSLDSIVSVVVSTAAAVTPREGFNIGLIIGQSEHITPAARCKEYRSLDEMIDDGFAITDPEYIAAGLYFGQTPTPEKVIIGRRDATQDSTETWVQALTDCRQKNGSWYGVYVASSTALTASEHQAVAAYIESLRAAYFFDDSAAADLTDASTDVFSVFKAQGFKRSFGLYSTTRYAAAAALGFAMGANDGTAGSAYTMAYKSLAGVTPDDLNPSQVAYLESKNANYYVTRGSAYNVLQKGVCIDGGWFDELIGLDQLTNDIQIACMDVLTGTASKIPYTDEGALEFVTACNGACEDALNRGFLAAGDWSGPTILSLETGDPLENGYMCQAEAAADQSAQNRANRVCPPIYVAVILAGAIHSVAIRINVV